MADLSKYPILSLIEEGKIDMKSIALNELSGAMDEIIRYINEGKSSAAQPVSKGWTLSRMLAKLSRTIFTPAKLSKSSDADRA